MNWTGVATMEVTESGQILGILKAKQDLQMDWRECLGNFKDFIYLFIYLFIYF